MSGIQLNTKTPNFQVSVGEIGVKASPTVSGSLNKTMNETQSVYMDSTQEIQFNCPQPKGGLGSQEYLYMWQLNPAMLVLCPIIICGDLVSGA